MTQLFPSSNCSPASFGFPKKKPIRGSGLLQKHQHRLSSAWWELLKKMDWRRSRALSIASHESGIDRCGWRGKPLKLWPAQRSNLMHADGVGYKVFSMSSQCTVPLDERFHLPSPVQFIPHSFKKPLAVV
jgi:hypothetical protein